jgi:hypothetical protein
LFVHGSPNNSSLLREKGGEREKEREKEGQRERERERNCIGFPRN